MEQPHIELASSPRAKPGCEFEPSCIAPALLTRLPSDASPTPALQYSPGYFLDKIQHTAPTYPAALQQNAWWAKSAPDADAASPLARMPSPAFSVSDILKYDTLYSEAMSAQSTFFPGWGLGAPASPSY